VLAAGWQRLVRFEQMHRDLMHDIGYERLLVFSQCSSDRLHAFNKFCSVDVPTHGKLLYQAAQRVEDGCIPSNVRVHFDLSIGTAKHVPMVEWRAGWCKPAGPFHRPKAFFSFVRMFVSLCTGAGKRRRDCVARGQCAAGDFQNVGEAFRCSHA